MIKYVSSFLVGVILILSIAINQCKDEKKDIQKSLNESIIKYNNLNQSVLIVNDEIERQRIDYEKKINEYKNRKPKTVFIPSDVNITRGDCTDVKNLIDSIRNINF